MIDKIPLNYKLNRYVKKITKDNTITVDEKKKLISKMEKDGNISENEQALLNALDEKTPFVLVHEKLKTTSLGKSINTLDFVFETPTLDDVKSSPHFKLEPGQSGPAIEQIQTRLQSLDYAYQGKGEAYTSELVDWIKSFQSEQGIVASGEVDQDTLLALSLASPKTPSIDDIQTYPRAELKVGDKGAAVKVLHQLLHQHNYNFQPDELEGFSKRTDATLREFQNTHDLPVTGILNKETLSALQNASRLTPSLNEIIEQKDLTLPITLHERHTGESVDLLNILLTKVIDGYNVTGNGYNDMTTLAVKSFQESNQLPITGVVDKDTLLSMEEATKLSKSQIYHPEAVVLDNQSFDNEFDRIKSMVTNQLISAEVDIEGSFNQGVSLLKSAKKVDKRMGSSTKCYTAVKKAVEKALDLPYIAYRSKVDGIHGAYARTADKTYFKDYSDHFVELKGLSRADTQYLPPGAIMVYQPKDKSKAGHIGVADGKGHDVSDKTRNQKNVHKTAAFKVYFPIQSQPPKTNP